jgi:hypothetical protein
VVPPSPTFFMFLRLLSVFCVTLATGIGAASDPSSAVWSGNARITFSGTSTLHDWSGTVPARPFTLQVQSSPDGRPLHLRSRVVIDAAKMDTADKRRDAVMYRCLKVTEHPRIEALIDVPAVKVASDGKTPSRLPMTLTLLGKPYPLVATVRNWRLTGDRAEFDLHCEVSLSTAGIEVPSVLWLIRVGDVIRLHVAVQLTRN